MFRAQNYFVPFLKVLEKIIRTLIVRGIALRRRDTIFNNAYSLIVII